MLPGSASPFAAELVRNAQALTSPGRGILAADESTGTIGKRFAPIRVENTLANRQSYREMLFTTPNLEEHISGVILFEETLFGAAQDGSPLVNTLIAKGIIPGLKVDLGVKPLYGTDGETVTQGLDDLDKRCAKAYAQGARFTKWRAVLTIKPPREPKPGAVGASAGTVGASGAPSGLAVEANAAALARFAAISQAHGLVPIVEPEVLMDGAHDLETDAAVTERVLASVFKHLSDHHVLLEGMLLKPNMCAPGSSAGEGAPAWAPKAMAEATVRALSRTVPCAVPGVMFLSGGMTEDEATEALHEINLLAQKGGGGGGAACPWAMSFSFGRALQHSCLGAWKGERANIEAAQAALLTRAVATSRARMGQWVPCEGAAE